VTSRNCNTLALFVTGLGRQGRKVVQTAQVRISDDDFGQRLKDMRLWLDHRGFEPSVFTYFYLDPGMMVRVCFGVDSEAIAFAEEFGGSLVESPASADRELAA
jgi:hypothetical protein